MNKRTIVILNLAYLILSNHLVGIHKTKISSPSDSYMTLDRFNLEFSNNPSYTIPSDSNDMIAYFSNLYKYSPMNSLASCGYVSLIQYLSYYDTFYNDTIIPEKYERNQGNVSTFDEALSISPGVVRQEYPKSSRDLYEFSKTNKDTDYQMYLMSIFNEEMKYSADDYSCSIGMWQYDCIFDTIPAFANATFT